MRAALFTMSRLCDVTSIFGFDEGTCFSMMGILVVYDDLCLVSVGMSSSGSIFKYWINFLESGMCNFRSIVVRLGNYNVGEVICSRPRSGMSGESLW